VEESPNHTLILYFVPPKHRMNYLQNAEHIIPLLALKP